MARNASFRFKEFTIRQDQCAMKVCTDACVLGAWADVGKSKRILDIGTGTGLLALMAAQRNRLAHIDAVEIDPDAFVQAGENVDNSPFSLRINVFHASIQDFEPGYTYDTVITNPPFFQSDLRSPREKKNQAHHADTLNFEELLRAAARLLSPEGHFHLILPVAEAGVFHEKAAGSGWRLVRGLNLFHQPGKGAFRQLLTFEKSENPLDKPDFEDLCIYKEDGETYDEAFVNLLNAFYLKF